TSAAVPFTVNKAAGTGTFLTLTPIQKQYSDRVLMEATVSPTTAAGTVTFQIGATVLAANVPVVSGKASVSPQLLYAPGSRIGTATVSFVNRTTLATLATVTVTPNIDHKTGTATYMFPASALGGTSQTITFGFVVGGNYTRNNTADNVTITIKP